MPRCAQRRAAGLVVAALLAASAVHGGATENPLFNALVRDSETTLHFRSHYLARDRRDLSDSLAWAGGGWVGYRSGWLADHLQIGLTGYTSQKIHGPEDKDGASLLLVGQRSYSVLGEAYASLKLGEHKLSGGRFVVNQFELNPQDTRMTPRSFEGLAASGKVGGIDYYLGRFEKMKARNWDTFEEVSEVAGAPQAKAPLWLISLRAKPSEAWQLGYASYQVRDVLTSHYAEASWQTDLSSATRLRLNGQYMRQGSNGRDLLTGQAFDTWSTGLKADLMHGPLTLSAIAMKTDEAAAYRVPFGSWVGYTCRMITNFNRAGERAWGADAIIDFATLGAPGLVLTTSATRGSGAINANTGAPLSRNTELDFTADYRFNQAAWPEWARPLWLRLRLGRLDQTLGERHDVTKEYHLILNYAITFK